VQSTGTKVTAMNVEHHGKSFREGQRVKHLAFHPGEGKHRDERQNDDRHGKENRPTDQLGRFQRDLANLGRAQSSEGSVSGLLKIERIESRTRLETELLNEC